MIDIDALKRAIKSLRTPTYEDTAYGDVINRTDVLALLDNPKNTMDPYCGCSGEGHDGPCYGEKRAGY